MSEPTTIDTLKAAAKQRRQEVADEGERRAEAIRSDRRSSWGWAVALVEAEYPALYHHLVAEMPDDFDGENASVEVRVPSHAVFTVGLKCRSHQWQLGTTPFTVPTQYKFDSDYDEGRTPYPCSWHTTDSLGEALLVAEEGLRARTMAEESRLRQEYVASKERRPTLEERLLGALREFVCREQEA